MEVEIEHRRIVTEPDGPTFIRLATRKELTRGGAEVSAAQRELPR
jgi:hypothetical protein